MFVCVYVRQTLKMFGTSMGYCAISTFDPPNVCEQIVSLIIKQQKHCKKITHNQGLLKTFVFFYEMHKI